MPRLWWCSVVIAAVGCNFPTPTVTPPIDAPVAGSLHVLLTEVQSVGTAEFIEIWNPTVFAVSLDRYYLTDFVDYWRYPAGSNSVDSDFLVRFPSGALMAPGEVKTIALRFTDFTATFSREPSYAIDEVSGPRAFGARLVSTTAPPSITDGGEPIALFVWDGVSDLVRDVDIVIAGSPSLANRPQFKASVDGPDADLGATPYRPEDFTFGGGTAALAPAGTSYKRRTLETGRELQAGTGNGLTGDDETSEQLSLTWDGPLFTAPTPGAVPTF